MSESVSSSPIQPIAPTGDRRSRSSPETARSPESPDSDAAAIVYPSTDGKPLAESFLHLYAILTILEVLLQYLDGQQATVLADQFLYYSEGRPRLRVAPDVMVIFGVEPGPRDNYKIWEEGEAPAAIFEVTSPRTRSQDMSFKKTLYAQLGVREYWLFDPKDEWIDGQLLGYELDGETYRKLPLDPPISRVLNLRLSVEGALLAFYRQDTGDRLLPPKELAIALERERQALQQERQTREDLAAQLERYRERFGELPD